MANDNKLVMRSWKSFSEKHPSISQFLVFFLVSNGITVLQMILMPFTKFIFEMTPLIDTSFQMFPIGHNLNGSIYYIFDYAKGSIVNGGGGGLAYFLAVQISLGVAQIINFFLQRNVTFKSKSNIKKAAFWYVVAYFVISIGAAALQGLYKVPIYHYFINVCGEALGMTVGDIVTMFINCAISFWVFFPIFKIIFKEEA